MLELLSISETAKLMEVCENTLRDWDENGKFKAERSVGGHRRYSLEQIRKYLEQKPIVEKEKFVPDITNIVNNWLYYLEEVKDETDKRVIAVLLENFRLCCAAGINSNLPFSFEDGLWLIKASWLRCKFRKMVSVQPALGPVMLTYFNRIIPNGGIKIDWHHVAAKTTAYNFCMFNNIKFEAIKEVYADCIASEISANIITRLPPCNIESFIDDVSGTTIDILKGCDYIATSESYLKRLKSKFNLTGIDVIEISTMLNPDSFAPLAVAGKYPLNIFTPPIFCPYILFSATPPTNLNYIKLVSRAGWFEYSTELKSKNIL